MVELSEESIEEKYGQVRYLDMIDQFNIERGENNTLQEDIEGLIKVGFTRVEARYLVLNEQPQEKQIQDQLQKRYNQTQMDLMFQLTQTDLSYEEIMKIINNIDSAAVAGVDYDSPEEQEFRDSSRAWKKWI